jgi:hypothetical protein
MAVNALKKITTRAKQIRRAHPGKSWKSAVKQAGAEYRGAKAAPRKKAARKKTARKVVRKKAVSGVPKRKRRVGSVEPKYEVVHQLKQVSGISYKGGSIKLAGMGDVNRTRASLKAQLGQQAGWLDVGISSAKTEREKKALRKQRAKIIRQLNRV